MCRSCASLHPRVRRFTLGRGAGPRAWVRRRVQGCRRGRTRGSETSGRRTPVRARTGSGSAASRNTQSGADHFCVRWDRGCWRAWMTPSTPSTAWISAPPSFGSYSKIQPWTWWSPIWCRPEPGFPAAVIDSTNARILSSAIRAASSRDIDAASRAQDAAEAARSVPQYLHFVAATGRSSERHAGHVFTGAGSPKTVSPRRARIAL